MLLSVSSVLPCYPIAAANRGILVKRLKLVSRFINTMMFADGACEARSRNEEEAM